MRRGGSAPWRTAQYCLLAELELPGAGAVVGAPGYAVILVSDAVHAPAPLLFAEGPIDRYAIGGVLDAPRSLAGVRSRAAGAAFAARIRGGDKAAVGVVGPRARAP